MKTMIMFFMVAMTICANTLEQAYFGNTTYDGKKREVALLLNDIKEEPGSYYAVVYEYLNAYNKDFIIKFLKPGKSGYLKELLNWVTIIKLKPISKTEFSIHKLVVSGGKIEESKMTDGRLSLFPKWYKKTIQSKMIIDINGKELSLNFYKTSRFPLKSSWEKYYVPGPYNPGYKQGQDVILDLARNYDPETKTASSFFNVKELNNKEMIIRGSYNITESYKGMFTFKPSKRTKTIGDKLINDKIGVFIDVYNFQPIMNTVELILIDPANAKNSQMYFEEFTNK